MLVEVLAAVLAELVVFVEVFAVLVFEPVELVVFVEDFAVLVEDFEELLVVGAEPPR